jgi:hypothetical protein
VSVKSKKKALNRRHYITKLFSGLSNILTCIVAAIVILFRQDWFGSGDIYSFVFWTIPIAVGLAISGETIINLFRRLHFLLRLLIIVVTAGLVSIGWVYFIYLILGGMINAFSIPIFYLWIGGCVVQLLFLDLRLPKPTVKPKVSKIVLGLFAFPLTLIAVFIVMFLFSLSGSYLTRPEKETYLIPNYFEGQFRIIYGEKCGINPTFEDGRRVLQIPENGILIIQPMFKEGTIDHEYFLVDKNKKRQKISMLWDYKQRTTKSPGVLLGGSGSMGGAMPDGGSSTESPLAIHFTQFTVYNKDTTTKDEGTEYKLQQRFDSLMSALVNECRQK